MQTWAKRGLQTALVTGGLLMLGTGIASAQENVSPDVPPSPIDGGQLVPTHFDHRTSDSQDLSRALRDQATDQATTAGADGGIPAPLRSGRHALAVPSVPSVPTVPQPSAPVDEPLTQPLTDPVLSMLPGTNPVRVDPVPNELRNTITENPLSLNPLTQPADLLANPVSQLATGAQNTVAPIAQPAALRPAAPQPAAPVPGAAELTDVLPAITNGLGPIIGGMDPGSLTGRTVQVDWANPVKVAGNMAQDLSTPDTQQVGPLVANTVGLLGDAPAGDLGQLPDDADNPTALGGDLLAAPTQLPQHASDLLSRVTGRQPATGLVDDVSGPATQPLTGLNATQPIGTPVQLPNAGVDELNGVIRDVVAEPEADLAQVTDAGNGLIGSDPAGTLSGVTGQLGAPSLLSAPAALPQAPTSVLHQVPTALLSRAMLAKAPTAEAATERATSFGIPDSVDNLLSATQLPDNTLLPRVFPSLRLPTSVPSSLQAAPGTLPMLPTTGPDLARHQVNTGSVHVGDVPGALSRSGLPVGGVPASLRHAVDARNLTETTANLGRAAGLPTNLPDLPATQDAPSSDTVRGDLPLTGELGPLGSAPVTANLPTDAVPFLGDFALQQVQGTTYELPSANSVMDTAVLPVTESALDRALPMVRDVPSGNVLPVASEATGLAGASAQDAPTLPIVGGLGSGLPLVGDLTGGQDNTMPAASAVPPLPSLPLLGQVESLASGLPLVGSLLGAPAAAPAAQDLPTLPIIGDLGSATSGLPLVGSLTSAGLPLTQDAPALPIVGDPTSVISGLPLVGDLASAPVPAGVPVPSAQDLPTLPIVGGLGSATSGLPLVGSLTSAPAPTVVPVPAAVPSAQDAPALPIVGDPTSAISGLPLVGSLTGAPTETIPAVPAAAPVAAPAASTQDLTALSELPVGGLPAANALPVVYQLPVGSLVQSVSVLPVSTPQVKRHWDDPVGLPANTFDLPVASGLPVDPVSSVNSAIQGAPVVNELPLAGALPATSGLPVVSDLPVASALPSTTLPDTNVGGAIPVLPSTQDAPAIPAVPAIPAGSLTGAVGDLLTPQGVGAVLRGATVDQLPVGLAAPQDAPANPLEYLPVAGDLPLAGSATGSLTSAVPAAGQLTGLSGLYATPAQPGGVNALDMTGDALLYGLYATTDGLSGHNVAQPSA